MDIHAYWDSGIHAGSVHEGADGSHSFFDGAGHFLGTERVTPDGDGHFINPFGVMIDRFHASGLGTQHFDTMNNPTFREQSFSGKLHFLDGMNRPFGSYDPMSSSFSTAMGMLRFRGGQ